MTQVQTQAGGRTRVVSLVVAAVVLIGGVVFGAVQLSGGNDSTAPTNPGGTQVSEGPNTVNLLPEAMGGEAAIDALGDDIVKVAKLNSMTVEELEELLRTDKTARVTKTGVIKYVDTLPAE